MFLQLLLLTGLALASPIHRSKHSVPRTWSRNYTDVVVFGDSFSDNGNGSYRISNGTWPPSQYFEGRFSNGPVWAELLASNLSAKLHDYAVGGSTTSNRLVQGFTGKGSTIPVPSTDEQVDGFLGNVPKSLDIPSTLFVVSGGLNDLFFQPNLSAYQSKDVLAQQVKKLQSAGAQDFVFFNYYDASTIPFDTFTTVENKAQNEKWSADFGRALTDLHASVPGSFYYDSAAELFPHLYYYGEPTAYGFDQLGAYGSCLVGTYQETPNVTLCDAPDTKVFWDEYHPTRVTHALFASGVLRELGK